MPLPSSFVPVPSPTAFSHPPGMSSDPPSSKPAKPAASLESKAPKRRRRFTAAEKLQVLEEIDGAGRGGQGAVLRKYGIYNSQVTAWRKALGEQGRTGLSPKRPGPKPSESTADQERIRELEKKLARAEKELEVQRAVNDLQKKVSQLFGIPLEAPKDEDS